MSAFLDTYFYNFDIAILSLFGKLEHPIFTSIAEFVSKFGTYNAFYSYCAIAIFLCLFKKTRKFGVPMAISIAIGSILTNKILKPCVGRLRPYEGLIDTEFFANFKAMYEAVGSPIVAEKSWPSGHTTLLFDVTVPLAFAFWHENKKYISAILLAFATTVALSRIYLMVHYPTDVLAGFIIGASAGIIGYYSTKRKFETTKNKLH